MEYVKQSMNQVWASAGDVVMPDNGKIQEGWLVEVPPRQYWNWMQNRADTNLAYIFQRGVPEWDANVEYLANKSFVVYNGVTYKAILTGTNQNPLTATTYWQRAFSTWSAAGEAVGALTPSANTYAYFTGASTAALGTITSFARSILDDATAGDVRSTIGAAPLASPAFTGTPTAPTAPTGTNTTQLATTAFVNAQISASVPAASETVAGKVELATAAETTTGTDNTRAVHPAALKVELDKKANIASPTFTGNPSAPTPPQFDNDISIATTEFVQRALGNFSASITVNASITLNAAHAGAYVAAQQNASPYTITLPPIGSFPSGSTIKILSTSTNKVTVQRNGSDTIYDPALVTGIDLGPGDVVALTSILGVWHVTGGGASLRKSADFGASISPFGYQKLPSGLIIQWVEGASFSSSGSQQTHTTSLPITFPNGRFATIIGHFNNGVITSNDFVALITAGTTNSTTTVRAIDATADTTGYSYVVLGY